MLLYLKLSETYLYLLECISQFVWSLVFQYPRIISSWQIKVKTKKDREMCIHRQLYKYVCIYICMCVCVCTNTDLYTIKKKFFKLSFLFCKNTKLRFLGVTLKVKFTYNWKEMAMVSIGFYCQMISFWKVLSYEQLAWNIHTDYDFTMAIV